MFQYDSGDEDFETLLNQPPLLTMTFLEGSKRSDTSYHLKCQVVYSLQFSKELTGQFDLLTIRRNYPYIPITTCPFHIPTMPEVGYEEIDVSQDNVKHYGITFTADKCKTLSISFQEVSSLLSEKDRQLKFAPRKARHMQLLLFSRSPARLLGKVRLKSLY